MVPSRRLAFATALVAITAMPAMAQSGYVTINGMMMHPYDAIAMGIPDGDYWLDPVTGYYGIFGDPRPLGQLGAPQAYQDPTGPGFNVRTPGGDLMSDGNCSFIVGVPVGSC